MNLPEFSILITTKNRLADLKITLSQIYNIIEFDDFDFIICDDGSTDGTYEFIKSNYPKIRVIKNKKNRGYIYSRNLLLSLVKTEFAITLDDDAYFISKAPLTTIKDYFIKNSNCGVLAFRIYWGIKECANFHSKDVAQRVKGFVGCGHVWRIKAWNDIPNYPEWFIFYGEEDFASYQLFKRKWEVHYLPEILVNHRVDIKFRKNESDYTTRLRRSLASGWFIYLLFLPLTKIPRKMAYSLWIQVKFKVLRGDLKALKAIALAFYDLVIAIPEIIKNSNRLSKMDYDLYQNLEQTKIYWKPEK